MHKIKPMPHTSKGNFLLFSLQCQFYTPFAVSENVGGRHTTYLAPQSSLYHREKYINMPYQRSNAHKQLLSIFKNISDLLISLNIS